MTDERVNSATDGVGHQSTSSRMQQGLETTRSAGGVNARLSSLRI